MGVEGEEDPVPLLEDGAVALINSTGSGRRLRDAFNWLSFSNWCGPGNSLDLATTPCPGSRSAQRRVGRGYDLTADRACRRHDYSGYKKKIGKLFPRCNCNSDRDLAAATNNAAVQIAYGKRGLAQFWGCYDKGKYYCWKGWRYGKY